MEGIKVNEGDDDPEPILSALDDWQLLSAQRGQAAERMLLPSASSPSWNLLVKGIGGAPPQTLPRSHGKLSVGRDIRA